MAARRHQKLLARSAVAAGTILAGIGIWTSVISSAPISAPALETDLIAPTPSPSITKTSPLPEKASPSQPAVTTPSPNPIATPRVRTRSS